MEVERFISDNTFDASIAVPDVSIRGSIPRTGSQQIILRHDPQKMGKAGISVMGPTIAQLSCHMTLAENYNRCILKKSSPYA